VRQTVNDEERLDKEQGLLVAIASGDRLRSLSEKSHGRSIPSLLGKAGTRRKGIEGPS
jgi:hypothetical protein